MSQYLPPNPQQSLQPYYPPNLHPSQLPYAGSTDPRAPAKRASILMFILGPMLNLCGFCMIGMPFLISSFPSQQSSELLDQIQRTSHMSANVLLPAIGVVFLVPGIALFTLAFLVRRGGRSSAIVSMVVVGLILLYVLRQLVLAMLHPMDPNNLAGIFVNVVLAGTFGLLFIFLLQAARASSSVSLAQQQYLAQYWQYQQNMQQYSGYGYATPPQEGQKETPPPPES